MRCSCKTFCILKSRSLHGVRVYSCCVDASMTPYIVFVGWGLICNGSQWDVLGIDVWNALHNLINFVQVSLTVDAGQCHISTSAVLSWLLEIFPLVVLLVACAVGCSKTRHETTLDRCLMVVKDSETHSENLGFKLKYCFRWSSHDCYETQKLMINTHYRKSALQYFALN